MPVLSNLSPATLILAGGVLASACGGGGGSEPPPPDNTPTTLAIAGGDGQAGETNAQLADPLQARVTNQGGDPVAGIEVNWSATGATVSSPTVASNNAGISQVNVTLGSVAGPITIVAESDGLTGSPLTFSAAAVAPQPPPNSANVTVRNDNFLSVRNGTANAAVDTIAVGGTVTWTWAALATNQHNVTSSGSPSFASSGTTAQPFTYGPITFPTAGTYIYYCTQHGAPTVGMRGRIVVR